MSKREALFYLVILVIVLLFFGRLFFPEPKLFYTPDYGRSDLWNFHYPVKDFLAGSLQQWEFPFWSKDMGTGFPVFAEGQIGTLNIMNLFLFSFFPTWIAWNFSYVLIFLLSFLGSYLFFKKIGISSKASLFSAFTFSFGGYFISRIIHFSYIQAASLLPWLFLLAEHFWKRPSGKHALLFGIVLSQQIFTGGFQWVFISLLGVSLYLVVRIRERDLGALIKKIALFSLALLLGLALAAPQLLPTLELKRISVRKGGLSQRQIFQYPYPFKNLVTFVLPDFFGTPRDGSYPSPFEEGGSGIYWENTAYVGILPLIFLLLALVKKGKSRQEKALWFLGVFSFLLVLGERSPLSFLYTYFGFNNFRVPSRFLILVTLSLTGLAGVGLDRVLQALSRGKRFRPYQSLIFSVVFIVAIVDLFYFGFSYHPLVPVKQALDPPETVRAIPTGGRIFTTREQGRVWNDVFLSRGWQEAYPYLHFKNGLDANLNLVFGRANVRSYSALPPIRQAIHLRLLPRMLDAAAAAYIISPTPLEDGDALELVSTIEPPEPSLPRYYVYENRESLDRFRFVSTYVIGSTMRDVLEIVDGVDFPFERSVILETDPSETFMQLEQAEISVLVDRDQRLVLATKTDKKAILVVADSFYPGWRATINGRETEIFPANINQRAVIVPSGENTVEMFYFPDRFLQGIAVSIGSLFAYLVITSRRSQRVFQQVFKRYKREFFG